MVLIPNPIPGLNGGIYKKVKDPNTFAMIARGDDFASRDGQFKLTWPEVGDNVEFDGDYMMEVLRWD